MTGYNRQEIAFYTRELEIQTREVSGGTVQEYVREVTQSNYPNGDVVRAHVGWDRDPPQEFINNWTTFDGRVEFGQTFDIQDTRNGTLIQSDTSDGTFVDGTIVRSIPTPGVAHNIAIGVCRLVAI